MNQSFDVIVVPAAEAHARFTEGLHLFGIVWPTLMAQAEELDAQEEARLKAERDQFKAEMAAYQAAYDAWRSKSWITRGPEPDSPPLRLRYQYRRYWAVEMNTLRNEIDQAVLAASAGHDMHMTQQQYMRMLAWASGDAFPKTLKKEEA